MKKRNLLIAAGVVAAGVCIWLIARPSKGPKVLLETAPISHITIRNSVTATGTVEPVTQVEVGTQVSGIIDKLYADYNDQVKAGQLIAEMDKVTLQAELESAQAQLASSKTEYEYQTKNYARTKTLHEKQLVSDAEYDQAFYLYETARNAYEQSQAAMVKVKRNLGYATITSPIDGVVISRAVEEGQTVAAGFETPTLFTIANDTFEGTVLQVRLEATTESNVVTYEVVIDAPNPDLKLKPGLTANVTIFTLEKDDATAVPTKALRFVPNAELLGELGLTIDQTEQQAAPGSRELWVKEGTTLRPRRVYAGAASGDMTEITEGLTGSEEIVTGLVTAKPREEAAAIERSPFMPGPPGSNNKKK